MNTLTKNRIIAEGDEYLNANGQWYSVLPSDIGLQVMFSKRSQVRRPSENPSTTPLAQTCTLTPSKDCKGAPEKGTATTQTPTVAPTAKADLPVPNGLVETLEKLTKDMEKERLEKKRVIALKESRRIATASPSSDRLNVKYPMRFSGCRWIGRNGTYNQVAINLIRNNGTIRVVPQGVRGEAKNAQIEFPVEVIPQLTDWLIQQQLAHKLTK